jgi:hypothetical protein
MPLGDAALLLYHAMAAAVWLLRRAGAAMAGANSRRMHACAHTRARASFWSDGARVV